MIRRRNEIEAIDAACIACFLLFMFLVIMMATIPKAPKHQPIIVDEVNTDFPSMSTATSDTTQSIPVTNLTANSDKLTDSFNRPKDALALLRLKLDKLKEFIDSATKQLNSTSGVVTTKPKDKTSI